MNGVSGFDNALFYYLETDGYIVEIEFCPAFGVGIGTQREEFEGYLSTMESQ